MLRLGRRMEGKSFARMLTDPSFRTRETLYFAYKDVLRSVKDTRYKLLEYRGCTHRTQLFDLINDPYEQYDLAANPRHAARSEAPARAFAALSCRMGGYRSSLQPCILESISVIAKSFGQAAFCSSGRTGTASSARRRGVPLRCRMRFAIFAGMPYLQI